MLNRFYIFPIAVVVVILDQLSKFFVAKQFLLGEQVILINNLLSLTKTYNTGAAFGIMQDYSGMLALFSLFVALFIIIYFIKKLSVLPYMLIAAWGLILGGTIGNMIDRMWLGYVIDFIRLDFINFPIFNIADLSINIGAFLIVLYSLRKFRLGH